MKTTESVDYEVIVFALPAPAAKLCRIFIWKFSEWQKRLLWTAGLAVYLAFNAMGLLKTLNLFYF